MNPARKIPHTSSTQPAIRTVRGVRIWPPQLGQGLTVPSTLVRHDGARQVLTAGIGDSPLDTVCYPDGLPRATHIDRRYFLKPVA